MSISCDCSCSCDVDWMPRCETRRVVRARKEHHCVECDATIDVGEHYERLTGVSYDGDPFSHATCVPCSRIRDHYCPNGYWVGNVAEQIEECIGWDYREDPPDEDDPQYDGNVSVRRVL